MKIAIPDDQEFGHLIRMIYTAAETGEYDEPAADELRPNSRDWYDRMFEDCQRIYQYNAKNKGACFDENLKNKGACFDPYACGKNIHIHSHNHRERMEGKRVDAEGKDSSSHLPYPEPPNAAETIYRTAINSGYLISARETKAFYMRYAANGWKDQQGNPIRDYRRILDFWRKNQSIENRTSGERLFQEYSRNGGFYMPDAIQNLDRIFNQTASNRDQTADPNQIPNPARIAVRGHNPGDYSDPDGDTWTDPDTFGDPTNDPETDSSPDDNGDPDDENDPNGDRYPDSG